jgi:hypothetical protein
MTDAPSALDPTPWPAADYTTAFAPFVRTTYTATYGGTTIPLWAVQLTISETSSPTATLEADTTAAAADAMAVRGPIVADSLTTQALAILTGYDDHAQARIFHGIVTEVESRSDGTAHIKAASWESVHDVLPSPSGTLPWTVPSTATTMDQAVLGLTGADWSPIYSPRVYTLGALTAPASYTPFRQQTLDATDTLLDFLLACANSLGQWLRGDQRGRSSANAFVGYPRNSPSDLLLSDRWSGGTAIDLTPITATWTRRRSVDDFADGLLITARYKSGGSEVTKTATYRRTPGTIWAPLIRPIDINYRPGSAFVSGSDRVAQTWAAAYAARTWKLTATCRAVWWLEPGLRATIAGTTGTIEAIRFQIDDGTMTIDLRPTVNWTP